MPERLVYEVIKPFRGDQDWSPGDLITDFEHWPFGRVERLIDQRLVRPMVVTVDDEPPVSLEEMSNAQLKEYAEVRGIDLTGHARSNQTIIDRIREHEEDQDVD